MNRIGQLVEESPITMPQVVAASPVQPGGQYVGESFEVTDPPHKHAARGAVRDESLVEEWKTLAEKHARVREELVVRERRTAISLARLAHAQFAAGMLDEAYLSTQDALQAVVESMQQDSARFDLPSSVSAVRLLIRLDRRTDVRSWLERLPHHEILRKIGAGIAASADDYESALGMLEGLESPDAANLRGYIYLQIREPELALRELRAAYRGVPEVVETVLNMAFAYWQLGSPSKAIRFARQASRMARSRKDISFTLIEMMFAAGRYDEAAAELKYIRSTGIIETADFLMMRAKVEYASGRDVTASTSIKRAVSEARSSGDTAFAELIQAHLSVLESNGLPSIEEQKRSIYLNLRQAIRKSPDNVGLIELFAANADRVSHAKELRSYVDQLALTHEPKRLYELQHRVAYLEGDFEKALQYALLWSESEPFNPQAASNVLVLHGQVGQAGQDYEKIAILIAQRFGGSPLVLNNVAFALALCGRSDAAAQLIAKHPKMRDDSFYLKATIGLVEVASGNLQEGMKLYREAAEMTDKIPDGTTYRALMTIHQAMALRQLGLLDCTDKQSVVAQALPEVDLPKDWRDLPHFRLLEAGALRRGWEWPLIIN
ncbi:tetratricopeptide repeat protein [Lentzea sp. NPDC058450]|uniref:tetratricopeptide repeat protein n=1 Tax=Lentzea sp. NPDC058450 TaxID=3346505 RepID=UPI003652CFCF